MESDSMHRTAHFPASPAAATCAACGDPLMPMPCQSLLLPALLLTPACMAGPEYRPRDRLALGVTQYRTQSTAALTDSFITIQTALSLGWQGIEAPDHSM
jgi:hypothetical protein